MMRLFFARVLPGSMYQACLPVSGSRGPCSMSGHDLDIFLKCQVYARDADRTGAGPKDRRPQTQFGPSRGR